ncbi:GNAT family N-acetyltransferase [Fictibacillus terranigra]|uniref:GNAT family N-acetyltransferase n=1 Tax=Fictibacillus terranigra TaxID=3058424 RepID=A0ABT8E0Q9_9BACL|nr:GNAT family N-acetyltransferase [Fictibacillus sp. CENA-BCM004]MDN4071491.1 GNAT family N-acetyltransferase [Fictibacillus sp. CENA-BCM004]
MSVHIRTAKQEDAAQLRILMLEYIVDFYKSPKPEDRKLDELICVLLKRERGIQFVAEQEGELKGFATLYFTYSTTRAAEITVMNDLYVAEDSRGTTAAQGLFHACKAYTEQNGYASMLWETAEDNRRAQRFYEKMGGKRGNFLTYSI